MSTATSTPMLSLSEFAHLLSEQHYHFLSHSLHKLELNIMDFQHQIARHFRFHPYGRPPSRIPPPTNHHNPPSNPSSHDEAQTARLCECHALVDVTST